MCLWNTGWLYLKSSTRRRNHRDTTGVQLPPALVFCSILCQVKLIPITHRSYTVQGSYAEAPLILASSEFGVG